MNTPSLPPAKSNASCQLPLASCQLPLASCQLPLASCPLPNASPQLPQYLPARMINEFTYCPRLFYYEHVEDVFVHNQETVEGTIGHRRVDAKEDDLPTAQELAETGQSVRARSVMLSSDAYGVIAKMDLLESDGSTVTPVDYKRGKPFENSEGALDAWDTDKVQLAVQALILRDNGYDCDQAIAYYRTTKQRVRIRIDDDLIRKTIETIDQVRRVSASGRIPLPLADSPKCPRCSLVTVCLPDETRRTRQSAASPDYVQLTLFDTEDQPPQPDDDPIEQEVHVRRLVPARDDQKPLYLNTQGLTVGKSGNVLKVKEKKKVVQEVRINDICQLNLFGAIQLSTQAIQTLCQNEVPIVYFSFGGWFYGITHGLGLRNIFLRREQFRWADIPSFCLRLARSLVAGKIRNQRTLLMRNHVEPPPVALAQMKCMMDEAERTDSMQSLLGIEGNAARMYFQNFAGMIKLGEEALGNGHEALGNRQEALGNGEEALGNGEEALGNGHEEDGDSGASGQLPTASFLSFAFNGRNRRPPRDPVNALLSLGYSVLAKDLTICCHAVGFDPYLGFYHQPRFGRPSLALDLMEPFRPLIVDSAVLTAINTNMITPKQFVRAGQSVALTADGRKAFFRAYEQRMDSLVTHPLFGYRVNYRRILEVQARLLARLLTGELTEYPVFCTR